MPEEMKKGFSDIPAEDIINRIWYLVLNQAWVPKGSMGYCFLAERT